MFRSYEPGRDGLCHAGRQLPAAAGSLWRSQLLQARRERAIRDSHRQRRRRRREHHLPIPVPEHPRRQSADRRRQEGLDSAGTERLGRRRDAGVAGAEHARDLHAERHPRPAPPGAAHSGDQSEHGRHDVRQAGRLHRRQDHFRLRRLCQQAHLEHLDSGMRGHRPRVCRPAQGSVRRQSRRNLRSGQHQVSGDRVESGSRNPRPKTCWPTRTSRR